MNKVLRKLFLFAVIVLTLSVFCVTSNAEEPVTEDLPQDLPLEEESSEPDTGSNIPEHIRQFVEAMDANGTYCVLQYTKDSVSEDGVYYEVGYDELKEQLYFEIHVDLSSGYVIYDKPETEYIDGVKINDKFLATNSFPHRIYLTDPTVSYTILVKTVYEDSLFGTLAKIHNGDATLLDLFDSPVILFQVLYYVLAVVSVLIGIVATVKSKKYKSKTSTEIANDTASAIANTGAQTKDEIVSASISVILETIAPMMEACLRSNQNVVKAMALSNSKAKDAPLIILDVLNDTSNLNISETIESLKATIADKIQADKDSKNNTVNLLDNIVNDVPKAPKITDEQRSVF